ncbi:MAG: glycoside hydrolase family 26 protein [Streptosporangiaceae bacterium]
MTKLDSGRSARRSDHRRTTWLSRHAGAVIVASIVLAAMIVVAVVKLNGSNSGGAAQPMQAQPVRYLGVYEPDAPGSYAGVTKFAQTVGRQPNLVGYYSGWNEPFQQKFAEAAASHGATAIVEINPYGVSLARIADGAYDSYLKTFADDVAAFGHTVVISFGHEMNGFWYSWGYHRTKPATFVAAWRHIVTVFRQQGADNVTWLWQVNSASTHTGPVRDWWPGSQYVNWVGISGYYFTASDTFGYIFDPVAAAIRQFTHDPVLIAETGVGAFSDRTLKIRNLFAGLRQQHYLGLVWFDEDTPGGLYVGGHWRLEGSPPALTAFRAALKG